jgi:small conductance mechanosensitive channel
MTMRPAPRRDAAARTGIEGIQDSIQRDVCRATPRATPLDVSPDASPPGTSPAVGGPLRRVPAQRAARALAEARRAARGARREIVVLGPVLVAILVIYDQRHAIAPGFERYVRYGTVVALVLLGWRIARDIGRAVGPELLRRLDPSTAGTVGFLIRLAAIVVAVLAALRIAGVHQSDLALGGAFTAVVVGLAAQQTLANLFAGMVLMSARPFQIGERVRFQAGNLAGTSEGTVASIGLMYVTLRHGADTILLPNTAALSAAVEPLREPDRADFTARLRPDVRVADLQRLLDRRVGVPTLDAPAITLESLDKDELVVRISATPMEHRDGPRLADELLAAIGAVISEHPAADQSSPTSDGPSAAERPATRTAGAAPMA